MIEALRPLGNGIHIRPSRNFAAIGPSATAIRHRRLRREREFLRFHWLPMLAFLSRARVLGLTFGLLAISAFAQAEDNSVIYWNKELINFTRLSRNPPPIAAVHMASYSVAIFDAVNGIDHRYHGWLVNEEAPAGANTDAAVASAAYTVLNAVWGQAVNPRLIQVAYDNALEKIPDSPGKIAGIDWGKHVASAVLELRSKSGHDKPIPGKYSSNEPGKWRETPSGFRPPVLPFFGHVQPFAMTSCDQFRAPPPLKIEDAETAEQLAYVRKVGARDNADRTEDQTLTTPFWSDDLGTSTPPGHWNIAAENLAIEKNLSLADCARLFGLLNIAEADAGISCWDTKFHYNTWRPETAIRELDPKTNPKMVNQLDFIPNMPSPAFPSYTSGHSTFSSAATKILELYFGSDNIEFDLRSDGLPGAVRHYKSFSEARKEVGMSRVWGGIHTMQDNLEGQNAGLKIGGWVFTHSLQPLDAPAPAAPKASADPTAASPKA